MGILYGEWGEIVEEKDIDKIVDKKVLTVLQGLMVEVGVDFETVYRRKWTVGEAKHVVVTGIREHAGKVVAARKAFRKLKKKNEEQADLFLDYMKEHMRKEGLQWDGQK